MQNALSPMMSRHNRRNTMSRFAAPVVFDQSQPLYARKRFTSNGHKYVAGQVYNWRQTGVALRSVVKMYDTGYITHKLSASTETQPAVAEEVKAAYAPKPAVEVEQSDELDEIDDMKVLREIATKEGAGYKVSKADQRQSIRDNRKERT